MKFLTSAAALAACALALCGCLSTQQQASIASSAATIRMDVGKGLYAAQAAFDAAVKTADVVVKTGVLPAATVSRIDQIADDGDAGFKLARQYYAASDYSNLAKQLTAISALATQLNGLVKTN